MKKRFLLSAVLLTLSTVLVAPVQVQGVPPALPYYQWGTGGGVIVTLPGGPPRLMIEGFDIRVASPIPPHDMMFISIEIAPDVFVPLVGVADHPDCAAVMAQMFSFLPWFSSVFVDEGALEIWSVLRVELNVPLEDLVTPGNGLITIPPFKIRLRSGPRLTPGEWTEVTNQLPAYTVYLRYKSHEATATVTGTDGYEWPAEDAIVRQPQGMVVST